MKDDKLLRRIGEALGTADHLEDPRWERLAAGELDDDQIEHLRRDLLTGENPPDPASLDAAIEALRPLDAQLQDRIAERFLASASPEAEQETVAGGRIATGWFSWLRGWRLLTAGMATAAAAVLILVLWPTAVPSLPAYRMEFEGGDRAVRGDGLEPEKQIPVLRPGSLLTIRLRPATRPDEPESVTLLAWLEQAGAARRIEPCYRVSGSGTVVIEGSAATFPLRPGPARLVLLVVPREHVDRVPESFADLLSAGHTGNPWQLFVQEIEYRKDP